MNTAALYDFLSRIGDCQETGKLQWESRCPCHDDNKPSLSVSVGDDGKVLAHCHTGCSVEKIVAAVGMRMQDLYPKRRQKMVAAYDYCDASGTMQFQVVRYGPEKQFKQRRPDGNGGWTWSVKGCPVLPYRLPELLAAENANRVVIVAEGEKDVESLRAIGVLATCNAGGAIKGKKCKWKAEHSEYLVGRKVAIIPDADETGRQHAEQVARSLSGKAASIKILPLDQKDATEWIAAGGTKELLTTLYQDALEWQPSSDVVESDGGETEPAIRNFESYEIEAEGKTKRVTEPLPMTDIIDEINQFTGNWPRRVENVLFVDDPQSGIDWFDRRTTAGLFGWLRRHVKVEWSGGGSFVSQAEVFAEIERTAPRYDAIELLCHEPPVGGVYYRGQAPEPGDGSHLRGLLDKFRPDTTVDRDLIQAAFMTTLWGGLPGCRPAFVVTSDDGRGAGKSKLAECIAYLCGGGISVSANEDFEKLKARLLSPTARGKRIVILDNVKSPKFSWSELEGTLTSPVISGRQNFVGESQRPNLLLWIITLNGISLGTDMAQRSVIIKLMRGKNDGAWWEETRRFIDDHRERIIGDIIAALRADPFPLAEYSRWATWEKHVLSRLPEPGDAQRLILERQGEANCELDEAEIIEGHFAEQLSRLGYVPQTAQVRIPVAVVARWYGWAVGEQMKTTPVSRRLSQMAREGQLRRLAPDPSRHYGRAFIWTGPEADVLGQSIANDLSDRLARRGQTA